MPGTSYSQLLERLARAALDREDVLRRALWMELCANADVDTLTRPESEDPRINALAAALAELLAQEHGQAPPPWTAEVGPVPTEIFLASRSSDAARKRLRAHSPQPLKQRNLFAPAKYLQLV